MTGEVQAKMIYSCMHRWVIIAALVLTTGATMPAWADNTDDCYHAMLVPAARAVSACRSVAEQGDAVAQGQLGWFYEVGWGAPTGLRRSDEVVSKDRRSG
jgi:hypothetical protein